MCVGLQQAWTTRRPPRSSHSGIVHEPVDDRAVQRRTEVDVGKERLVLVAVLVGVRPAVVETDRIDGGVGDRVELVVAEHDLRRARIDHRPHEAQRLELAGTAIDQVTDEDCGPLPVRVDPDTPFLAIAEQGEQASEPGRVAVHVADDVVRHASSVPAVPDSDVVELRPRVAPAGPLRLSSRLIPAAGTIATRVSASRPRPHPFDSRRVRSRQAGTIATRTSATSVNTEPRRTLSHPRAHDLLMQKPSPTPPTDPIDRLRAEARARIDRFGFTKLIVGTGECTVPGCDCEPEPHSYTYTLGMCDQAHPSSSPSGCR